MKEFMPIILGSDENAYGFARSFYSLYEIKPIALTTHIMEATKYSNIINFMVNDKLHDEKELVNTLIKLADNLKKEYKKIFLIPCSDAYMEMVIHNQDLLSMYENRFISYKKLIEFNNKESFYNLCNKYSLPYPPTVIVTKNNYKYDILKINFDYPLILKPNNSNSLEYLNAKFEPHDKVFFINDHVKLLEIIEKIYSSSYKDNLIVQKFISGSDTNMRVLNTYSDRFGKVKMMCLGQPILEEYHPKTYGNYAAIISFTKTIPIMDDIRHFLDEIHYIGPANFDIKMDANTHEYYIFEINPRPGRSSYFTACAGLPLAECYVDDLIYGNLKEKIGAKKEILWLNAPLSLIKKYVKDHDVMTKVKKLISSKSYYHVLKFIKDFTLSRKYIYNLSYLRKIRYFPKYYIKKK